MYGFAKAFVVGRLTKEIQLSQNKQDNSVFCYFDVAVNPRPYTNRETGKKVEPEAQYFTMYANGFTAESLAKHTKKGSVIVAHCTVKPGKNRRDEYNGKTYVDNAITFSVDVFDSFEDTRGIYGKVEVQLEARLTRDIQIRNGEGEKKSSFCFFDAVVNPRARTDHSTGERVESEAQFFNLFANGPAAEILSKYAHKGTVIAATCSATTRTKTEERDGKTFVYKETPLRLNPGMFEIINKQEKDEQNDSDNGSAANAPAQPAYAPPAAPAATQPMSSANRGYDSSFDEDDELKELKDKVGSSLPF